MNDPKFNVGDTVRYNDRQGRIIEIFKESNYPIMWRYYILMRDGVWSVTENAIEKLIKGKNDDEETD